MQYLLILLGFLLIILAAILQAYCEYGRQARPDIQPHVFTTGFRYVMEGGWWLLMLLGAVLLFGFPGSPSGFVIACIGIVLFWLVLPFIINPILRKRLLPPWDDVKEELEPKGYKQSNYLRGNWWKKDAKVKRRKS